MELCEISLRSPSGAETFVRMQSVGSRGAGDTTDLLVTLIDLTELKRAEETIEVLNADLEERVRERTAQLDMAYKKLAGTINERQELRLKFWPSASANSGASARICTMICASGSPALRCLAMSSQKS